MPEQKRAMREPPEPPEPPWEEPRVIPAQMRRVNNLIFRKMRQNMREYGVDDITPMHMWIMCYLSDHSGENIFQRDVERQFSITRSTVTNIIQLMEQKGYIERQGVPHDARLKRLVLTAEGTRVLSNSREALHSTDDFVGALLTDEENAELLRLLEKLRLRLG